MYDHQILLIITIGTAALAGGGRRRWHAMSRSSAGFMIATGILQDFGFAFGRGVRVLYQEASRRA